MQRQSLGSSSTKNLLNEIHKQLLLQPNSSSTNSPNTKNINTSLFNEKKEEKEFKKLNPKPNTKTTTTHETYVHLIPMLTLLCFLILYLSSHNPSKNDMDKFNGFNHLHNNPSDLGENVSEINGAMEIKKEDVLFTIRSLKSDRQLYGTVKPPRLHRKIVKPVDRSPV